MADYDTGAMLDRIVELEAQLAKVTAERDLFKSSWGNACELGETYRSKPAPTPARTRDDVLADLRRVVPELLDELEAME